MKTWMRILCGGLAVLFFGLSFAIDDTFSSPKKMSPQEIASVAEKTPLVPTTSETQVVLDDIFSSVEKMGVEELAAILSSVKLSEDTSLQGSKKDLRLLTLVVATQQISKQLLAVWRHKPIVLGTEETERISRMFAPHPFLLLLVCDDAETAAKKILENGLEKIPLAEMTKAQRESLLQAANLYNFAGTCIVVREELYSRTSPKPQGAPNQKTPPRKRHEA